MSPITKRSPEARVAYVQGYAAGFKAAREAVADGFAESYSPEATLALLDDSLDRTLDLLSAQENAMRELEGSA